LKIIAAIEDPPVIVKILGASSIPEPMLLVLLGTGLIALLLNERISRSRTPASLSFS
jgi:hypothetical protein